MLIQFRTENHRSLRDGQVLSLVAGSLGDADDPRLISSPALTEKLLPAVAIYGANASGKTNALLALAFMREAVSLSYRQWEPETGVPNEPFALSTKRSEPSLYEVDIIADDVRFRYGFVISEVRVEEEWLFAWPNGHKQTWFEREGDEFTFGRHLHGDNEAIRKLTRANSLFLSVAAQNNHVALTPIFSWFRTLRIDYRRGRHSLGSAYLLGELFSRQLTLFNNEDGAREKKAILELLRASDTGIVDMRVDEAETAAGPSLRGRRRVRLQFLHKAEDSDAENAWLPLEVESAGTLALIDLAPQLTGALRTGGVMCVDEMESSLHPMLALALLRLFQDPSQNTKGAQLLFTTHDTNLLGNVLGESPLRRDQIWFTEKDASGASHLYPLTDFHPRKQENLERGYLQGRYGAIPFLGDLAGDGEDA